MALTDDERKVFEAVAFFDVRLDETASEEELSDYLGGRKLTMVRKALPRLKRAGLVACYSKPFYERRYRLTDEGRAAL